MNGIRSRGQLGRTAGTCSRLQVDCPSAVRSDRSAVRAGRKRTYKVNIFVAHLPPRTASLRNDCFISENVLQVPADLDQVIVA
jgi:hypothetical protein